MNGARRALGSRCKICDHFFFEPRFYYRKAYYICAGFIPRFTGQHGIERRYPHASLSKMRCMLRPFSCFLLLWGNCRRRRRDSTPRTRQPTGPFACLHERHGKRGAALRSASRPDRARGHTLRDLRTAPFSVPRLSHLGRRRRPESRLPKGESQVRTPSLDTYLPG